MSQVLRPSAAHRWVVCPGSVALSKDIESTTSEHAEEGTLAHEAAAALLNGQKWPGNIPDDMYAPVYTYTSTVESMSGGAVGTWVEQRVDLSDVYGVPDQFGTADFIAIREGELQIHDLKYGKGVEVSAENNWQLIIYALGALEFAQTFCEIETVRGVIHQPRLGIVSEVVYTVEELLTFLPEIRKAAAAVMAQLNGAELIVCNPGEKQCQWCPAKGSCEALVEYALSVIVGEFSEVVDLKSEIKEATDEVKDADHLVLSKLLDCVDLISGWIKAVETRAHSLMLAGEQVPGYKLVTGRAGARKWVSEDEVTEVMKSMRLKHEEMYEYSLISPTSAEKLLKDSARKWNRLAPLITQAEGKPTIAPESDKRPALNMGKVEDQFQDLTNELLNF